MKKVIFGTMAALLSSAYATAAVPVVEDAPVAGTSPLKSATLNGMMRANPNKFFEDFEDRPDATGKNQSWLPDGWQDVSKVGHTDAPDQNSWNLTWQVTTNDDISTCAPANSFTAYSGECFAFIMCDVAYGDKWQLEPQDEWLITPTITPDGEDWFYFKLAYSPAWTVYNREAGDFTGQNSALEVYVSDDNGENWEKAWSVIDEIRAKYTDEELRQLLLVSPSTYSPIYVDVKKYYGKPIKLAFRYFGSAGQPMAIDDVSMGVPQPVSSYLLPRTVFMQGLSPDVEYPADPRLLIAPGTELTWVNTSTDVLRNVWEYTDASGAAVTSEKETLTTPAYDFLAEAATPRLTGYFESRSSEPFQLPFTKMQAGGFISGKDTGSYDGEFGVSFTDVFDGKIVIMSEYMSLNPQIDLAWEKIQGYLDGTLDVLGFCSLYPKPDVPYGFDFIDLTALVKEDVPENDGVEIMVYPISVDGEIGSLIGASVIWGKDIPKADPKKYVNLRFQFPVPVYAEESILVILRGCLKGGNIVLPYVASQNPYKYGNNLVYWIHYDNNVDDGSYDEFKNLSTFPSTSSGHFAGFLMSLGASYSNLEIIGDNAFQVPDGGGKKEFTVKSFHKPERWVLSTDGVTPQKGASVEAVYDAATDTYKATVEITTECMDGNGVKELRLHAPGAYAPINLTYTSAIEDVEAADAVSVTVDGDLLVVSGEASTAELYDLAGKLVGRYSLSGSKAVNLAGFQSGVYLVRIDGVKSFKIVK